MWWKMCKQIHCSSEFFMNYNKFQLMLSILCFWKLEYRFNIKYLQYAYITLNSFCKSFRLICHNKGEPYITYTFFVSGQYFDYNNNNIQSYDGCIGIPTCTSLKKLRTVSLGTIYANILFILEYTLLKC